MIPERQKDLARRLREVILVYDRGENVDIVREDGAVLLEKTDLEYIISIVEADVGANEEHVEDTRTIVSERRSAEIDSLYVERFGTNWDACLKDGLEKGIEPEALCRLIIQRISKISRERELKFSRLLNPVRMAILQSVLSGQEPARDEDAIFHFMGSGASDQTTFGEFRELMGDERRILREIFNDQG